MQQSINKLNISQIVKPKYSIGGLIIFNQVYQEIVEILNNKDKVVIAINGAPYSGKSTLAQWINYMAHIDNISSITINTDNYMCIPRAQRLLKKISGFDINSYNLNLLETHVKALRNIKLSKVETIKFPVYNTNKGLELSQCSRVKSNPLIILDGLMSYSFNSIELIDVYIWLEMPNDKRKKYRTIIDYNRNYNKLMALVSLDVHERDWPNFKKQQSNVLKSVCDDRIVKNISWDDVRINK
jgi:uridine kinase